MQVESAVCSKMQELKQNLLKTVVPVVSQTLHEFVFKLNQAQLNSFLGNIFEMDLIVDSGKEKIMIDVSSIQEVVLSSVYFQGKSLKSILKEVQEANVNNFIFGKNPGYLLTNENSPKTGTE